MLLALTPQYMSPFSKIMIACLYVQFEPTDRAWRACGSSAVAASGTGYRNFPSGSGHMYTMNQRVSVCTIGDGAADTIRLCLSALSRAFVKEGAPTAVNRSRSRDRSAFRCLALD